MQHVLQRSHFATQVLCMIPLVITVCLFMDISKDDDLRAEKVKKGSLLKTQIINAEVCALS